MGHQVLIVAENCALTVEVIEEFLLAPDGHYAVLFVLFFYDCIVALENRVFSFIWNIETCKVVPVWVKND